MATATGAPYRPYTFSDLSNEADTSEVALLPNFTPVTAAVWSVKDLIADQSFMLNSLRSAQTTQFT